MPLRILGAHCRGWGLSVCNLWAQATARTYEEAVEEAVEVAEEKLLSDRPSSTQEKDDKEAEELVRRELQAWDEKFEKGSRKERDHG